MEPERFMAGYHALSGIDLHVHMQTGPEQAKAAAQQQAQPVSVGEIAIIALHGTLMKTVPSAMDGTSTVLVRRKIRAAAEDPAIAAIMLHIDSPGGTVAGTEQLAADIRQAGKRKPVYAYIDDVGASGAYWPAAQAAKIFAGPTALVGSIGTYSVVHDFSGKAEKEGIKVHVVRAGEMKGQGTPGTEVSAALLAEIQGRIDHFNEFFIGGVATGRRIPLEKARALADGRLHGAAKAQELGLIDGVMSFDGAIGQLVSDVSKRKPRMETNHAAAVVATATAIGTETAAASGNPSPQGAGGAAAPANSGSHSAAAARPASIQELRAACEGAPSEFLLAQLESGATIAQAQTSFVKHLQSENAKLAKQAAEKPAAAAVAPKKPGAQAVPAAASAASDAANSGDAVAAFNTAVDEEMQRSKKSREQAHLAVCRRQPELREAMVAEHNALYPGVARKR